MNTVGVKKGSRRFKPKGSTPKQSKRDDESDPISPSTTSTSTTNTAATTTTPLSSSPPCISLPHIYCPPPPLPQQHQQYRTASVIRKRPAPNDDQFSTGSAHVSKTPSTTLPTAKAITASSSLMSSPPPLQRLLQPSTTETAPVISSTLLDATFNEYMSPTKKRVIGAHSKEELELMTQQKTKEEEEEKAKKDKSLHEKVNAPQVKLVNGQIVLDESSLWIGQDSSSSSSSSKGDDIDKQGDQVPVVVVEEGAFAKMQRGPKGKPKRWSIPETELFYDLLEEFGTDFESISQRIPGKTREQVHRKYKDEAKRYPHKIDKCLTS